MTTSGMKGNGPSETLAVLGDSELSYIIVKTIIQKRSDLDPGKITQEKQKYVANAYFLRQHCFDTFPEILDRRNGHDSGTIFEACLWNARGSHPHPVSSYTLPQPTHQMTIPKTESVTNNLIIT